jgi:hypothetical protein
MTRCKNVGVLTAAMTRLDGKARKADQEAELTLCSIPVGCVSSMSFACTGSRVGIPLMMQLSKPEQRADEAAKFCNGNAWHNLEIPPNQVWIAGVLTEFN